MNIRVPGGGPRALLRSLAGVFTAARPKRASGSGRKTKVWITIDCEPSSKYENGCWDYCVNGVWPRDLDGWYADGIAEKVVRGYRLTGNSTAKLSAYYADSRAPDRVMDVDAVDQRIARAEAGMPLIFSVLREFGATATCFLDASQLYIYGERLFREACDLIELSGNDLQLHLHPESLSKAWYERHGLDMPTAPTEMRPVAELTPLLEAILSDFNRFATRPPVAYRAGAYRISPQLIDALQTVGIGLDTSFDMLNKKGHVQLNADDLYGNFPVRYRGILEAPISAYTSARRGRIMRFVPGRLPPRLDALQAMNDAGVPLITYILHSYGFMNVYGEGKNAKTGRLGPDPKIVANFRTELAFLRDSPDFEFVGGARDVLAAADDLLSAPRTDREIVVG